MRGWSRADCRTTTIDALCKSQYLKRCHYSWLHIAPQDSPTVHDGSVSEVALSLTELLAFSIFATLHTVNSCESSLYFVPSKSCLFSAIAEIVRLTACLWITGMTDSYLYSFNGVAVIRSKRDNAPSCAAPYETTRIGVYCYTVGHPRHLLA